jgi:hypothetical protein
LLFPFPAKALFRQRLLLALVVLLCLLQSLPGAVPEIETPTLSQEVRLEPSLGVGPALAVAEIRQAKVPLVAFGIVPAKSSLMPEAACAPLRGHDAAAEFRSPVRDRGFGRAPPFVFPS